MTRLNLLLLVALLGSALYLVRISYESRQLFVALERERNLAHQLEVEAEGLDVARRAQATSVRVERVAREQLQMRSANPAVTEYIALPAALMPQGTPLPATAATAASAAVVTTPAASGGTP